LRKSAALLLFLWPAWLFAAVETHVSGSIDRSENWTASRSPYIIENTVTIGPRGFLTIHPGTVVKFKEAGKIEVKGALYARGEPANPVRFIPFDGESFYEGLVFKGKYKNTLEFCIVIRGAVASEGSPIILANNYFANATGVLLGNFAEASVRDNVFYGCTYGIYAGGKHAKFIAEGNNFIRNRFAVYLNEAEKHGSIIRKNNFIENRISLTNFTPDSVEAKDNYWGTDDDASVAKQIFDRKNNSKVGEAVFRPYEKRKLDLYAHPDAFSSLLRIYLNLKRPDEEPARVSGGFGGSFIYIIAPAAVANESQMGWGTRAEFTFNITGAFKGGVEAELASANGMKEGLYEFNFKMSQFLATFYAYMGYKKNVFFVPFAKAGAGVGLLSYERKYFDNSPSEKYNSINFAGLGGLGFEFFATKNISIKAEAVYNCTVDKRGAVMYPMAAVSSCVYFDTPLFVNEK